MSLTNIITLGIVAIVAYGTIRVWISDVKRNKDNIKQLWGKIDEIEKEEKKMAVSIGRLETKLNNK